ncbi:SinR family protein [Aminobacter sp. SR38]|uniref:SinR family protein n=1 Tax=Aminobacter sp. SR38 TaxID=2774562 RepID=UPI00177EB0EC|nr:SinR family protein [Aminobacter sp. SR38]QOF71855.1 SinR family protein [Aminobacter sp. SR38]
MAVFVVTYDLRQPGRNYQPLYDRLAAWKALHCLDSVWIIKWDTNSQTIRDDLLNHMDSNDGLLVAQLSGQAAWTNLDNSTAPTLKNWLEGK